MVGAIFVGRDIVAVRPCAEVRRFLRHIIAAPALPDTGTASPRTAFAFGYSGHTQRTTLGCIPTLYQCSFVLAAAPTVFSPYIPLCKKAALRSPSDGTIIAR